MEEEESSAGAGLVMCQPGFGSGHGLRYNIEFSKIVHKRDGQPSQSLVHLNRLSVMFN